MVNNPNVVNRLVKKAVASQCRYKVSAVAYDAKGDVLGYSCNKIRFGRKGGGIHAEMVLMAQYKDLIKTILICRANRKGELMPIVPCDTCKRKAEQLGIKIYTVMGC